MRVLVLCDHGLNRSITLAHHLKFMGHDVLVGGVETNEPETLAVLLDWAEKTIITADDQLEKLEERGLDCQADLWDIGPDVYKRPFNRQLLMKVRGLIDQHRHELEGPPRVPAKP